MTPVRPADVPPEPEVTDDAFLGGALAILQPRSAYRAGLDAVLLAAAIPVRTGPAERVLDAGSGVGVVGLCIARRCSEARVTLVEIEPRLAALARANAARNGLAQCIDVIEADVAAGGIGYTQTGLAQGHFDHVVANPPYQTDGRASRSPDRLKAQAHGMAGGALDAWLRFLAAAAKSGGTVTLVHRIEALPELLAAMTPRFGALKLLPIHPRDGEPARRLIIQGIKGNRAPLQLLPGLVLHGEGHAFRAPVDAILREGQPLVLRAPGEPDIGRPRQLLQRSTSGV